MLEGIGCFKTLLWMLFFPSSFLWIMSPNLSWGKGMLMFSCRSYDMPVIYEKVHHWSMFSVVSKLMHVIDFLTCSSISSDWRRMWLFKTFCRLYVVRMVLFKLLLFLFFHRTTCNQFWVLLVELDQNNVPFFGSCANFVNVSSWL